MFGVTSEMMMSLFMIVSSVNHRLDVELIHGQRLDRLPGKIQDVSLDVFDRVVRMGPIHFKHVHWLVVLQRILIGHSVSFYFQFKSIEADPHQYISNGVKLIFVSKKERPNDVVSKRSDVDRHHDCTKDVSKE